MITKLDLMDEGTDAREILENKLLPLRRGTTLECCHQERTNRDQDVTETSVVSRLGRDQYCIYSVDDNLNQTKKDQNLFLNPGLCLCK